MMQIAIPDEMEAFVKGVVKDGSFRTPVEVIAEALRLLERRQQLTRDIQQGIDQLERGEYTEYGENDLERFAADIEAEERNMFSDNPK
jgi:antitoxin ParD1/3/4